MATSWQVCKGARRRRTPGEEKQTQGTEGGISEAAGRGWTERKVVLQRFCSQVQQG